MKPQTKGPPYGLACHLFHSLLAMILSLLGRSSWLTNWELAKTDLGRTFGQRIRTLLTSRTSCRKNALARKFRLVLGTGPGVGRWNKIGCCHWCGMREARRWQGWLFLLLGPLGSCQDEKNVLPEIQNHLFPKLAGS